MSDFTRAELLTRASAELWAILPSALQAMLSQSKSLQPLEVELVALSKPGPKAGRVVRVPIVGPISRRDSIWSMWFGGVSVERLTKILREASADDTIGTVMLDIDSPGGTVSGMPALASEVRRLAESKHVVAVANSLAASAAYWLASQADEIIATPEALVGSVGVLAVHEDWSKALEQGGIKVTYISAGKYKTEGNPEEPLTDEARAHIQSLVDDAYALFVGDVAQGRGVSAADVKANYGEGRLLTAKDAKAAGMIDRVAGIDDTIRRLTGVRAEASSSLVAKRRRVDLLAKMQPMP